MVTTFRLTEHELELLADLESYRKNPRVFRRITALRMKHNGFNNTEIARALNVDRITVGRWVKAFKTEGVPGIAWDKYKRKRSKLTPDQWFNVLSAYDRGEIREVWALKRYIEHYFGITYNQRYLSKRAKEKYNISFRNQGAPTS